MSVLPLLPPEPANMDAVARGAATRDRHSTTAGVATHPSGTVTALKATVVSESYSPASGLLKLEIDVCQATSRIPGPATTTITALAHVLTESRRPDRGGRFLRGSDGDLSPLVHLCSLRATGDAFGTLRSLFIRRRRGRYSG